MTDALIWAFLILAILLAIYFIPIPILEVVCEAVEAIFEAIADHFS